MCAVAPANTLIHVKISRASAATVGPLIQCQTIVATTSALTCYVYDRPVRQASNSGINRSARRTPPRRVAPLLCGLATKFGRLHIGESGRGLDRTVSTRALGSGRPAERRKAEFDCLCAAAGAMKVPPARIARIGWSSERIIPQPPKVAPTPTRFAACRSKFQARPTWGKSADAAIGLRRRWPYTSPSAGGQSQTMRCAVSFPGPYPTGGLARPMLPNPACPLYTAGAPRREKWRWIWCCTNGSA